MNTFLSPGQTNLQVNSSWGKFVQLELVHRLVMGGQTDLQVGSQVHASYKESCKFLIFNVESIFFKSYVNF